LKREEKVTKDEIVLEAIRKFVESFGIDPMRIRIEKRRAQR